MVRGTSSPGGCAKSIELEIPDDIERRDRRGDLRRPVAQPHDATRLGSRSTAAPRSCRTWATTSAARPSRPRVPLTQLQTGTNVLNFQEATGPYHVHDVMVRVYYDASNPIVSSGDVTPPTGPADLGRRSGSTGARSRGRWRAPGRRQSGRAHGDGQRRQVRRVPRLLRRLRRGQRRGHAATGTTSCATTTDQEGCRRSRTERRSATSEPTRRRRTGHVEPSRRRRPGATCDSRSGSSTPTATSSRPRAARPPASTLQRSYSVEAFTIDDFQDRALFFDRTFPQIASDVIELPTDFDGADRAYLIGNYWESPDISINDTAPVPSVPGRRGQMGHLVPRDRPVDSASPVRTRSAGPTNPPASVR